MRKTSLQTHQSCSMQKTARKNHLIFEKWEHFETGQKWPQWKGYSPCKILSLGQKINCLKHAKTLVQTYLSCSMQKKGCKKKLILKKGEHFENGQKWPQCKGYIAHAKYSAWPWGYHIAPGYSLCKMADFFKSSYLSAIWCFFERFFAENNSNVLAV